MIGGGPVSPNRGPSWHAIGTGGDGSDILFQNTNGQTSIWDMNGSHLVGGGAVSANGGPNWKASFSASPQRSAKGERGLGDAGFERRSVRPQGGGEMARVDVVGPIPLEAHLGQFS